MRSDLFEQVWKPKNSVKIRFALSQGAFIAVIIALLAVILYFPVRQRLVTITDNSYRILADNLSSSIYNSYVSQNRQDVVNAVRRVEGQQGVKYVIVTDKNNVVYYDTLTGPQSLQGKVFTDSLTSQVSRGDLAVGKVQRNGVTYYNYVSPFISQNQVLYTVRLGIDQEIIDGEFNRLADLFIYLGAFGIFLGVIASYLLAARLTKPIIMLTESALAIRAGNLNAYPSISTNDELEQLSREFQNMVEKLKQYYFQEFNQKKQALDAKKRLEEINNRLNELDRQKSDFLNAASHQLRTPLSIIHWSLSLIVEEAPHMNLPAQQLELLEESLKSTKRMVDLVNDLLDISRIEQGRKEMTWAKGNFGSVCSQLVKSLEVLAAKKNLRLTYQQIGEIPDSYLDEKNFYQVVNNFVDNAIKYTAEGEVKVSCEKTGDSVVVKVADTGIGMTQEEKDRLFVTRFNRGDEASKMFANGTGLGMYVAHEILTQHGGSVKVESEKGKGTTFILTVPFYADDPSDKSKSKVPTNDSTTSHQPTG
ncbi:HAMP domain-containing protein [Patescibacteria group bacterium]|nr:HAMP domain-containing protein [Patescibacteria group bacterium]